MVCRSRLDLGSSLSTSRGADTHTLPHPQSLVPSPTPSPGPPKSANPGLEALFSSYIKAGQEVPAWILETYCRPPAITTAGVAPAAASSASSLSSVSSFASNLPGNLASREVNSVVAGAAKSALNQERITEFMGGVFEDRTSAYTAVQLLSTMHGHKGKQDPSISGKGGFTVVCNSAIESFKVPKMSSEGLGVVAASGKPVLVDKIRRVATQCGFCVKVNKRQAGTCGVVRVSPTRASTRISFGRRRTTSI